jgi:hypothetical protein
MPGERGWRYHPLTKHRHLQTARMADPKAPKSSPPGWPLKPTAPAGKPEAATPKPAAEAGKEGSGRVVHDSRGNAIWDWVKETGRICIDSTSAMLKKLEVPGLKMEGEKDDELRLESDRDKGGGYDPYNQRKPVPKSKPPGKK